MGCLTMSVPDMDALRDSTTSGWVPATRWRESLSNRPPGPSVHSPSRYRAWCAGGPGGEASERRRALPSRVDANNPQYIADTSLPVQCFARVLAPHLLRQQSWRLPPQDQLRRTGQASGSSCRSVAPWSSRSDSRAARRALIGWRWGFRCSPDPPRAKRLLAAADASAGCEAVTAGTLISGCGAGARAILSPWLGYPSLENAQRQPPTLTRSSARALDRLGSLRARRARSRASFDSPSSWALRVARLTPARTSRDRFGRGGRPSR